MVESRNFLTRAPCSSGYGDRTEHRYSYSPFTLPQRYRLGCPSPLGRSCMVVVFRRLTAWARGCSLGLQPQLTLWGSTGHCRGSCCAHPPVCPHRSYLCPIALALVAGLAMFFGVHSQQEWGDFPGAREPLVVVLGLSFFSRGLISAPVFLPLLSCYSHHLPCMFAAWLHLSDTAIGRIAQELPSNRPTKRPTCQPRTSTVVWSDSAF